MKSLLSTLAVISLTTPVISSLISQNTNNDYQLSQTLEQLLIYFTREIEFHEKWIRPRDIKGFVYGFNIGQTKLSDYRKVSVIDSNNRSYTKISWGNDAYYGDAFRIMQNKNISDYFVYKKINTLNDALNSAKLQVLNIEVNSGAATLRAKAAVGLSYYSEGDSNYLQVFGYFKFWAITSLSNGAMWINLGQGVRLH